MTLLFYAAVTIAVSLQLLSIASGILVPFLTELATKELAPGWVRIALLTALSAVGGALAIIIANGGVFALQPTLYAMAVTFVTALGAHYGFTIAGTLPALRKASPNFGVGPNPAAHVRRAQRAIAKAQRRLDEAKVSYLNAGPAIIPTGRPPARDVDEPPAGTPGAQP